MFLKKFLNNKTVRNGSKTETGLLESLNRSGLKFKPLAVNL